MQIADPRFHRLPLCRPALMGAASMLLILASCSSGGEVHCTENARCPSGEAIKMCIEGESVQSCQKAWLEVGGETYSCNACSDCLAAQQKAMTACAAASFDGGPGLDALGPGTDATPQRFSIPTLRNPAAPGRPPFGTQVEVEGAVVTAVKAVGNSRGFTIQDPTTLSWGGIYVHLGSATPTVTPGAVVRVSGTFSEFRKLEEISLMDGGAYSQTGTAPLPTPIQVAPGEINGSGARAAELQSMLLQVKNVTATSATQGTDFTVSSSAGASLVITSFLANDVGPSPFVASVGQTYTSITGLGYITGPSAGPFTAKLAPRSANDLQTP